MLPIIVVEGVPLFRRGVRRELERAGEWVVLESTDTAEIIELVQTLHPSCAIIDGSLTAIDPLEVCWTLRQQTSEIGILVLAQSPDEEQCFQFLKMGANAYESRTITSETLVDRVTRVGRGEYLIASEVLVPRPSARIAPVLKTHRHGGLGLAHAQEDPRSTFPLSAREVEMLEYIARGNSNKEIAKSLNISDQTVKNHITSILKKLSADDRTAAVVHALRRGWITFESDRTET